MKILQKVKCHQDLLALNPQEREALCREIRTFLIENVSKTGGHVASNLGVVELTVAIETVFNTAKDRLVFDVGHQSYIHKMLTGRQADFAGLRQFGGMAGFPKPSESDTDAFVAGHASSSVSIGLGMARARTIKGENYNVVTLIGDGAASGGIAYEGLNDAAVSGEPMVVVLNDNALSIDKNVGGMASHLRQLRVKERYLGIKRRSKTLLSKLPFGRFFSRIIHSLKDKVRRLLIPTNIFESMGFTYIGPVDGHDTEHLIYLLKIARDMKRPVLLHVITQKGRGYAPAQEHPKLFHGIGKFDPVTGEPAKKSGKTFSDAFGEAMIHLAENNPKVCAITAAMPGGTGLLEFKKKHPGRTFDVGIAEEHALSMAGGLAKQGMIPVVALYSTFLQRAYDMILQDVCMLGLHVVLAVDRAGLVGEDGETHHGVFAVGFLRQAPGMQVLCPASGMELGKMLTWAVEKQSGPVAIRYPRGGDGKIKDSAWDDGAHYVCKAMDGTDLMIVAYGPMVENALEAAEILRDKGINAGVIRLMRIAPLPTEELIVTLGDCRQIIVLEETCTGSGIREALAWELQSKNSHIKVSGIDLGLQYIPHGSVDALHRQYGLDAQSVADYIMEVHSDEN